MQPDYIENLIHDLRRNSFARTSSFGNTIAKWQPNEGELRRLIPERHNEWEIINRTKHDRSYRPGCHFSPRAQWAWSRFGPEIEEWYWRKASIFDRTQVYAALLLQKSDYRRAEFGQIRDPREYRHFLAATQGRALASGEWVGKLDIHQFYRWVNPIHILDLLGRGGLGMPPILIDKVSSYVDDYRLGLPQGSIVSDLIARLLLTPLDQRVRDSGLPCIRFVDDFYVFGHDRRQAFDRLCELRDLIEDQGFQVNGKKWEVIPPNRQKWTRAGITWGPIKIEDYEIGDYDPSGSEIVGRGYDAYTSGGGLDRGGIDWISLYRDEFSPGKANRSDHGRRRTLLEVAKVDRTVIVADVRALVRDNSNSIGYILRALGTENRAAAWDAYVEIPDHIAKEDDRLTALEGTKADFRSAMALRFLRADPSQRATRQYLYDSMPRTDEALQVAASSFPNYAWVDEQIAFARLLDESGGKVARALKSALLKNHPNLREMPAARS